MRHWGRRRAEPTATLGSLLASAPDLTELHLFNGDPQLGIGQLTSNRTIQTVTSVSQTLFAGRG